MSWPTWIERLRDSYLADEASVFLLHGAVDRSTWDIEGAELDCTGVLQNFLSRSREILGSYQPGVGMRFVSVTDHSAFHRMVETRQALDGAKGRLGDKTPEEALALIYLALTTPGKRQGYIVSGVEQLAPVRRKNLPPLAAKTPPLASWPSDPAVRRSDSVVILLTRDLSQVREDLVAACRCVEVPAPAPKVTAPPPPPPAPVVDEGAARAAAEAELEQLGQPPPLPPAPAADQPSDLSALVNGALRAAILRNPKGGWVGNQPGREALAEVLRSLAPDRFGEVAFVPVEGQLVAEGPGAEAFQRWYSGDIAVDAACGMALNELTPPEAGFTEETLPEINPAALRAMTRRLERLLKSPA